MTLSMSVGISAAEAELIIATINYIPASTDIKKCKPIYQQLK